MDIAIWEDAERKRVQKIGMWLLIGIASFYAIVCTAVSRWASSDVLIADTVFPSIWDMIQRTVMISFYWVAFSFWCYLSARYTMRKSASFLIVYLACVVVRYFLSWLIGALMLLEPFEWSVFFEDLLYTVLDILFDLMQMGLVILLFYLFVARKKTSQKIEIQIGKAFAFSNPFLRCLLFSAMIPAVIRILSRIRYDIFYGAPQDIFDLLFMIFYYVSDVLFALIGYLVIYLIVSHLKLREEERANDANLQGSDL